MLTPVHPGPLPFHWPRRHGQYDKSPTPEYDTHMAPGGGGGGKSGLDGIFADLHVAGGAAGSGGAGAAGRGGGGGVAAAAPGATEKDSLLGGFWGRS